MKVLYLVLGIFLLNFQLTAQGLLVEAESFDNPGGWVVDPQFEQQMGSPYLMAHGMGIPVKNAHTQVKFAKTAVYHIWGTYPKLGPWSMGGLRANSK